MQTENMKPVVPAPHDETRLYAKDALAALPRRLLLQTAGLALGGSLFAGADAQAADAPALPTLQNVQPPAHNPSTEYVFSIMATIADAITVGETAQGQMRAIPITGGEVEGEGIRGKVVPGGADWQLTRADGVTEIEATYAIQLDDGSYVKVINRGLIVRDEDPSYFRTVIHFDAPANGPWTWMNTALFLCRAGLHPDRERTVLVEVFRLV